MAAYYFSKALSKSAPKSKDMLLSSRTGLGEPAYAASKHWMDKRPEITFNVGLQFLLSGRASQASQCFEQCIPVFRNWPRLWIRIAECCIEVHRLSQRSEKRQSSSLQSWNRAKASGLVPSGGSLCDYMGPTAVGSGVSKLACGMQGFGLHRRLLLMVDKGPVLGKVGEEEQKKDARQA